MSAKVWIDGRFHDKLDAKVSVFDHGMLFADGVTVATRIYDGRLFRIDEVLSRLYSAAYRIELNLPYSPLRLRTIVQTTVDENRRREGYVRILATRGAGTLSLDPRKCDPCVVVIAEDVVPYPRELYDSGLDVITCPQLRNSSNDLDRAQQSMAKRAALRAGCLDAILCNSRHSVLGSTDAAVFVVREKSLIGPLINDCPDPEAAQLVFELAREIGLHATERDVVPAELATASEIFLAGQAGEVIAVRSVDGQTIGTGSEGPITRQLRTLYREAVRRL